MVPFRHQSHGIDVPERRQPDADELTRSVNHSPLMCRSARISELRRRAPRPLGMRHSRFLPLIMAGALAVAGCAHPAQEGDPPVETPGAGATLADPSRPPDASSRPSSPPDSTAEPIGLSQRTPSPQASTAGASYRIRYGWAVPESLVRVAYHGDVPIAPPPAPALPYLVELRATDYPDA